MITDRRMKLKKIKIIKNPIAKKKVFNFFIG